MIKLLSCLTNCCDKKNQFLEKYLSPLVLLASRLMVATIFLKSGLTKLSNMDSTIFLFENEYNLPFLSPSFAAYSGTYLEIICGGLLIVGLASRLATIPLIIMTLTIQFLVLQNHMHYYWLTLLGVILTFGPGCISLDKILKKCAMSRQ